ncbi:MAG: arylsulfatase, partial [Planctomycetota bacterium]
ASLLTGLHPHQTGVGHMMGDDGIDGYRGDLNFRCVTIADVLRSAGYSTYMSGKWHVSRFIDGPTHSWPCQRGFDRFHGIIEGASSYFDPVTLTRDNERIETPPAGDYFFTDAISDEAARFVTEHAESKGEAPFFMYVAYTAPHWPLQAPEDDIKRYAGRFDRGWDILRQERLARMIEMGIIDPKWKLSDRDEGLAEWERAEHKSWQLRRMEVYAAQIDRMDQGIGRVIDALRATGKLDDTLVIFLADNGGCAEELSEGFAKHGLKSYGRVETRDGRPVRAGNDPGVMPGGEDTYQSCGLPWANVSNTPFRLYKHWVHEGGISTPLVAHWPAGIVRPKQPQMNADERRLNVSARDAGGSICVHPRSSAVPAAGVLRHRPGQLPDIMATCIDVAGARYPAEHGGNSILPLEGHSLMPIITDDSENTREALYWEHEGNRSIRRGKWKLVCRYPGEWELYDIVADRTELHDLAADCPEVVEELSTLHDAWQERCTVTPWSDLREHRKRRREEKKA